MADIRDEVRKQYGRIASVKNRSSGCCAPSCCSPESSMAETPQERDLGYAPEDLSGLPVDADMSLGCGNPHALASLQPGQTVLDLGSGGGLDCLIAARHVGPTGSVIGVDMTPEMIARARQNAAKVGATNVDFRLGEIEHVPVADGTVDVIMSNCVINLSPDKAAVYREAHRVLRSGGRLAIADVVARAPIPDEIRKDVDLHTRCVAGAETVDEVRRMLTEAGFEEVEIRSVDGSAEIIRSWNMDGKVEDLIASALITATKR